MKIEQNKVVALTYDLHTVADGEESFVERAPEENPLVFLYGVGMMLPKFEEHLSGLAEGDTYDFTLSAADAYGESDPRGIITLPLDMFAEESHQPRVGDTIHLQGSDNVPFPTWVLKVDEQDVVVDRNHPMAGKTLHFNGTIVTVREATEDELSHGHAHGADGHGGH